VPAEVRLYDNLFATPQPEAGNFAAQLNPNSLETLTDSKVEPAFKTDVANVVVQFERQGYFVRDRDSAPDRLVFNRTVGLRDSYAKVAG
jgi:glutaminyl-tRNA synthetase